MRLDDTELRSSKTSTGKRGAPQALLATVHKKELAAVVSCL